jgi:glycosyltransferase involved in cell wall biosynthesis
MNIHIIFPFQDGPYGGGNQFLKALRKKFREMSCYAETPEKADVFLFNSFQDMRPAIRMKRQFPDSIFVHRVDGPISLYRNSRSTSLDHLIFSLNSHVADATIYQSKFSMEENRRLGMPEGLPEKIIFNAPDRSLFFPAVDHPISNENRKIRLVSTSWSSNRMKGFDVYEYLDKHLDFSKYTYSFIGNTPISFKNISVIPVQPSEKIADILRSSDIYITASRKDPCSNSLIEALSCGLPAIAVNDGGHPELIQNGGELFDTPTEIPEKIIKITKNYQSYRDSVPKFSIDEKASEYLDFFEDILQKKNTGNIIKKRISPIGYATLLLKTYIERI